VTDHATLLRGAGLRATPQRLAILAALEAVGGHPTADELQAALREGGSSLPRASLYHALASMSQAGVVIAAETGPGTARYEIRAGRHHHLVCRSCGAIVDVPCVAGATPCLDASLPGAEIEEAQVVFRGRCPACAAGGGTRGARGA
jgi:Fur family ferric uptake transcriptional regulator